MAACGKRSCISQLVNVLLMQGNRACASTCGACTMHIAELNQTCKPVTPQVHKDETTPNTQQRTAQLVGHRHLEHGCLVPLMIKPYLGMLDIVET